MKFDKSIKVVNVNRVVATPKYKINLKPNNYAKPIIQPKSVKSVIQPAKKTIAPKPKSAIIKKQVVNQKVTKTPRISFHNSTASEDQQNKLKRLRDSGVGKCLVIVGNGPSVSEIDLTKLSKHPKIDIMSINTPDVRIWPTTHWLFCDASQYKRHRSTFDAYNGTVITTTIINAKRSNHYQATSIGGKGFSLDLVRGFHIGRSSVYAAMQVANWMNYDHIYIVGVDMCAVDNKLWYFGVNPDVKPEQRIQRFDGEAKHYEHAGEILPNEVKSKFTFCSSYLKYSFTNMFNKLNHIDFINAILERCR